MALPIVVIRGEHRKLYFPVWQSEPFVGRRVLYKELHDRFGEIMDVGPKKIVEVDGVLRDAWTVCIEKNSGKHSKYTLLKALV